MKWLMHSFVPHEENGHEPHLLRKTATKEFIALVLIIEAVFLITTLFAAPAIDFLASLFPEALVSFTNDSRSSNAVASLSTDLVLERAAQAKAEDMASRGYFSHNGPDGKTPWEWFKEAGYQYTHAGENLAVNFVDSKDVVDAWMRSPSHRANILNGRYTEIGIGVAQGTYEGRSALFVVQFFGNPLPTRVAETPAVPEPSQSSLAENTEPEPTSEMPPEEPTSLPGTVAGESEGSAEVVAQGPIVQPEEPATEPSTELSLAGSSAVAEVLSSPRRAIEYAYVALAGLVAVALAIFFVARADVKHPRLAFHGLLLFLTLTSVTLLNRWVVLSEGIVLF